MSHVKSLGAGTKGGFILSNGELKSKRHYKEGTGPQMGLFQVGLELTPAMRLLSLCDPVN